MEPDEVRPPATGGAKLRLDHEVAAFPVGAFAPPGHEIGPAVDEGLHDRIAVVVVDRETVEEFRTRLTQTVGDARQHARLQIPFGEEDPVVQAVSEVGFGPVRRGPVGRGKGERTDIVDLLASGDELPAGERNLEGASADGVLDLRRLHGGVAESSEIQELDHQVDPGGYVLPDVAHFVGLCRSGSRRGDNRADGGLRQRRQAGGGEGESGREGREVQFHALVLSVWPARSAGRGGSQIQQKS